MRRLWPAGVALGLAILLASVWDPDSPASRISNLDLRDSPFRDTYIIPHRTQDERCFVVDRRDATRRRSDDEQPGRKWKLTRVRGSDGAGDRWMVQSKRRGKGTVFFVPALAVSDWAYPYLYSFVRARNPELELPLIEWTQLHVDRVYQGLYLRVTLPFDERKKDGGSGILREILTVSGDRATGSRSHPRPSRNHPRLRATGPARHNARGPTRSRALHGVRRRDGPA